MRLITQRTLEIFAGAHTDAREAIADFCAMVEAARWQDADHLKRSSMFPARPIGDRRVVFNLKGNRYRVVAEVRYADESREYNGILYIQFIGTHSEYDQIDPQSISFPRPP